MKKLILAALGLCLVASTAWADWKYTDLQWTHVGAQQALNNGSDGTTFVGLRGWLRDTTYIPMGASKVDTTTEWSMLDAEIISPVVYGHPAADTSMAGFFVLVADSSVASTITWGAAATIELQANYGRGANWTSIVTYTLNPTAASKVLVVPITASLVAIDTDFGLIAGSPLIRSFPPRMRAIVTGGTSAAAPQTRARVLKSYSNVIKAGRDFN